MEIKKLRAAIYLRVSTDEQIKGYGLTYQKEKLMSFIQSQEYTINIKHIYTEEGYSGTLPISNRPELNRLFNDAKNKEFDVVLVYKLDRFFRKLRLLLEAVEILGTYDVGFRSITELFDTTNSSGKFMTSMFGAVAEMERDTIRERTMSGKTSAAKAGKWTTGVPPYGYRVNKETKKLAIFEEEADVVKKMFELLVYEKLPLREIGRYMKNSGIKSPKHTTIKTRNTHNVWHRRTIGRILTNETYTGRAFFRKYKRPFNNLTSLIDDDLKRPKGDWIEIPVPPIVSQEMFENAKEQLTLNRERAKRNMKRSYMFARILYCAYCRLKLFSGYQPPKRGRGGIGTKYYHGIHIKNNEARKTNRCTPNCPQCAESRLEPIWDCLKDMLKKPKNILEALEQYSFKDESKESIKNKILKNEKILQLTAIKRKRTVMLFADNEITEKEYKKMLDEYRRTETYAKEDISRLDQSIISKEDRQDRQKILQQQFEKIKNKLENLDYEDKQYVLSLFVEKIILYTKRNYAEVIFRFPSEDSKITKNLHLNIKIKSESEIRSENKPGSLIYRKLITV